jgi:hypothetical protein
MPVLAVLAGCATDPAPLEQIKLTEQAVEQARIVVGSTRSDLLELADRKLQQAKAGMNSEKFKTARILAEQSELDARLAEMQVVDSKQRLQVQQLEKQLKDVRRELEALQ